MWMSSTSRRSSSVCSRPRPQMRFSTSCATSDLVLAAQRRVPAVEPAPGFEAELVLDPAAHQLALVGQLEPVAVGMAAQLLDHRRPDAFGQRPIGGRGRHDATAPGEPSRLSRRPPSRSQLGAAHISGGANASATRRAARCRGLRDSRAAGGRPVAPHGRRARIVGQLADQRRLTAGGDLVGRVGLSRRDDQQGGAGAERPGPQQVEEARRGADRGQGRAGHHQDPVAHTRAGRGCRAAVQVAAQIAQHIDGCRGGPDHARATPTAPRRPGRGCPAPPTRAGRARPPGPRGRAARPRAARCGSAPPAPADDTPAARRRGPDRRRCHHRTGRRPPRPRAMATAAAIASALVVTPGAPFAPTQTDQHHLTRRFRPAPAACCRCRRPPRPRRPRCRARSGRPCAARPRPGRRSPTRSPAARSVR